MFWGKYYIKVCCMRHFCLLVIKIHYVVLLPYIRITCPSRPRVLSQFAGERDCCSAQPHPPCLRITRVKLAIRNSSPEGHDSIISV